VLLYLLENKKTTYQKLAKKYEVSLKTIERDVQKLFRMGVPVYTIRGRNGGVAIEENYKLKSSYFSTTDLQDIILALTIYDSMILNNRNESIYKKLLAIDPSLTSMYKKTIENYFVCELLVGKLNLADDMFRIINRAFSKKKKIELKSTKESRTVVPINYVLRNPGMHLYCYESDYLLLNLSHYNSVVLLEEGFEDNFIPYNKMNKY
jgi:predicted DNA-binding transcriptional regulator YafY